MAQSVQIPGAQSTAKICNVVGVGALSLIPFYTWIWWYRANRALADHGKARGTEELGTSPGKALLAITLGALIIVPAIMSFFGTHKRIVAAQNLTGQQPINGWISILAYFIFSPAWIAYMQGGLNSVWENSGSAAAAAPVAEITEVAAEEVVVEEAAVDTAIESSDDKPSAEGLRDEARFRYGGAGPFLLLDSGRAGEDRPLEHEELRRCAAGDALEQGGWLGQFLVVDTLDAPPRPLDHVSGIALREPPKMRGVAVPLLRVAKRALQGNVSHQRPVTSVGQ